MSKPCSGPGIRSPSEVRQNRVKDKFIQTEPCDNQLLISNNCNSATHICLQETIRDAVSNYFANLLAIASISL
jgi:hypothetical protein